ncbi:MAG: DUF3501 family protein [Actinomycetota bacterium]|nr:DUF3501 family protein [Actinomycetota bacterium]
MSSPYELTLADIAELRAYERERDEFRRRVIAVKKLRRVAVGPIVSCTFENRMTMRFQVQEMARAEGMTTDEQVLHELEVYNRLVPRPGELSVTLFLELTDEASLRHWLPALVGIERSLVLRIGDPDAPGGAVEVVASPDEEHESQLTRETVTAAVHYVRFRLDPEAVERFATGPVRLAVVHPAYPEGHEGTLLPADTVTELLADLRGTPATW